MSISHYKNLPVVNVVAKNEGECENLEHEIKQGEEDPAATNHGISEYVRTFRGMVLGESHQIGNIIHGKNIQNLPKKDIREILPTLKSAFCSPQDVLTNVHEKKFSAQPKKLKEEIVQGIENWNNRESHAYGITTSLYEKDNNSDEDNKLMGHPVADSLAVITYQNCGILAVADGVSWGYKSKLSSNCAIYGSITYLSKHLTKCNNTRAVFRCILKSFENAQNVIMDAGATMTTLCVGVIVELKERNRYAFCVVNVGDTYAYFYNSKHGVKEVTEGSHSLDENRDMRFCGGALGPADGCNPDLGNLTLSYVVLEKGDLVFLCSDGISDNFDPVIAKFQPRFKLKESPPLLNCESNTGSDSSEHCYCKSLNGKKHSDIAYRKRGSVIDIGDKIPPSRGNRIRTVSNFSDFVDVFDHSSNDEDDESGSNDVIYSDSRKSSRDYFENENKTIQNKENSLFVNYPQQNTVIGSKENGETSYNTTNRVLCRFCEKNKKKDVHQYDSNNNKKKKLLDIFKPKKNKLRRSISDQSICDNFPPISKLESGSLDSLYVSISDLVEKQNRIKSPDRDFRDLFYQDKTISNSYAILNIEENTFSFNRKDSETMIETLSLTPRERHRGILEQMEEVIKNTAGEPISGDVVKADDICTRILSFVLNRTTEKRGILEKQSQSELKEMTLKERKKHNEELKVVLNGVPGKLDHVSIVAYEVGCMAPKLPSPKPDAKTTISPESSFDIVEDFIPTTISDARRKDFQDFLTRRASAPNAYQKTNNQLASVIAR